MRKQSISTALLAALLLLLTWEAAGAAEKVGLITDIQGTILLKTGESAQWERAFLTELLREGDLVKVSDGSRVVIQYFSSNTRETVQGPAVLTVRRAGGKLMKGEAGMMKREPVQSGLSIPRKVKPLNSYKPLGVVQRPAEDLPMTLVHPGPGTMECRPAFAWIRVTGADSYQFLLYHITDGTMINSNCPGNSLAYPESSEPMKPGDKYTYKIEALHDDEIIDTCGGSIRVLSPGDMSMVKEARRAFNESLKQEQDHTSAYISMILIYMEQGLQHDAFELCRRVSALHPEDRALHEWLRDFYRSTGNSEEKAKEDRILKKVEEQ